MRGAPQRGPAAGRDPRDAREVACFVPGVGRGRAVSVDHRDDLALEIGDVAHLGGAGGAGPLRRDKDCEDRD